jgi:hypothetical protein
MKEEIYEIKEIKGKKRTPMRKYVASYPSKFGKEVEKRSMEGIAQLFKDTSEEAEAIFRTLFRYKKEGEKSTPRSKIP